MKYNYLPLQSDRLDDLASRASHNRRRKRERRRHFPGNILIKAYFYDNDFSVETTGKRRPGGWRRGCFRRSAGRGERTTRNARKKSGIAGNASEGFKNRNLSGSRAYDRKATRGP